MRIILGLFLAFLFLVVLYCVFWRPLGLEICRKTPAAVVESKSASVENFRPHKHHIPKRELKQKMAEKPTVQKALEPLPHIEVKAFLPSVPVKEYIKTRGE